jgi:hypothetical protein
VGSARAPRAAEAIEEGETLRKVDARLDVVPLVVSCPQRDAARLDQERRWPKVAALVLDAGVTVQLYGSGRRWSVL